MIHTGTPHRSLKERQRQERAALILQAAEEVLAEKGYHETSMDEIAARVGVAKGTVYLHFPSKEDLVFALFEQELVTWCQQLPKTIDNLGQGVCAALIQSSFPKFLPHLRKLSNQEMP